MATRVKNTKVQDALALGLAQMFQNQALLLSQMAQLASHADEDRRRFARIEQEMFEIKSLLLEHDRILKNHEVMLKNLPEAIRQKIGFQPQ